MENTTTTCEVIVDGKRLMLSSEKNIEHLNRIAVYLNGKIKQVKSQQFYFIIFYCHCYYSSLHVHPALSQA